MLKTPYTCYEVVLMSEKEQLFSLIEQLSEEHIETLRKVAKAMVLAEEREILKLNRSTFGEWDNDEDDVYNDL